MVSQLYQPDEFTEADLRDELHLREARLRLLLPEESDLEQRDSANGAPLLELTCVGIALVLGALAILTATWSW